MLAVSFRCVATVLVQGVPALRTEVVLRNEVNLLTACLFWMPEAGGHQRSENRSGDSRTVHGFRLLRGVPK